MERCWSDLPESIRLRLQSTLPLGEEVASAFIDETRASLNSYYQPPYLHADAYEKVRLAVDSLSALIDVLSAMGGKSMQMFIREIPSFYSGPMSGMREKLLDLQIETIGLGTRVRRRGKPVKDGVKLARLADELVDQWVAVTSSALIGRRSISAMLGYYRVLLPQLHSHVARRTIGIAFSEADEREWDEIEAAVRRSIRRLRRVAKSP